MFPPKAHLPTTHIKFDCLHSAPLPTAGIHISHNWQIIGNMLHYLCRRSDLGVVSSTLSSDMRGSSLSCSAAASFFPLGKLTPWVRLVLFDSVMKFYFSSNLDLTIFSHPLHEDWFVLLQIDNLERFMYWKIQTKHQIITVILQSCFLSFLC